MKKKGLSLLLALSMVFTMNAVAFAGETTEVKEDVNVQYDYDDTESYNSSTVSADSSQSINGTNLKVNVADPIVSYTGSKLTAAALGITITDTSTGYTIPVKKIKLTGSNKKATATGSVTYKLSSIYNWKYIYKPETIEGDGYKYDVNADITATAAKAAYKTLKSQFKSAKSTEFKAYIKPHYIESSVSSTLVKSLKKNKSLSADDLRIDADGDGAYEDVTDCVIVNTKSNGAVKSVQIPVATYKFYKTNGTYSDVYTLKLKLKKLKKNTDYTISGNVITFKDSSSFSGVGSFGAK